MRLPAALALVLLAGCAEKTLEMRVDLPADKDRWDTSCVSTIEVYTDGPDFQTSDDYRAQSLELDSHPATYDDVLRAIRGKFDVGIPDSGLAAVEMYGWNGPSGFDNPSALPELVFYSMVDYQGESVVSIPLVPNMDCRTSSVTVRPIDLISLVTTKNCTMAAIPDTAQGYVSIGTLSPGLYEDYLFGWGGVRGAAVTGGIASMTASTTVGPQTCLAVYGSTLTAGTSACANTIKACATGNEVEAVLVDYIYAQNSIDATIQLELRGAIVGAAIDGTKTPIAGVTIDLPAEQGRVVYIDHVDTTAKRLVPSTGTATTAAGMFIIYTNDLATPTFHSGANTKTVTVGAPRPFDNGNKNPAGLVVTF